MLKEIQENHQNVKQFDCFTMMIHNNRQPPCVLKIFMPQQQQNLGRKFGTSKMHVSPPVAWAAVHSKVVVLFLLIDCWLLLQLCDSGMFLCFVVRYFMPMSKLVLQSSWLKRESWLLCFNCLPGVFWQSVFCGSSSRWHGFVCSLWLFCNQFCIVWITFLFNGVAFF